MWQSFTNILLNLIFPEFCCCCGKIGCLLCDDCYERLNFLSLPIQPQLEKSYLSQITAVLQYDDFSRQLISELKYKSVKNVGRLLGELIYYTIDLPPADIITAVPLHPNRQRLRGFNQAELIAKELAILSGINYQQLLNRTTDTAQQAKQHSRSDRISALRDSFELAVPPTLISGKSILLIDDVVTTGSTLNECAIVLNNSGSSDIFGLALSTGNT